MHVQLRSQEGGESRQPKPIKKNDQGAERSVKPVIGVERRYIPVKCRRTGEPEPGCRDRAIDTSRQREFFRSGP